MTREEREDAINFFKEVAKREVGTYCKLAIEALQQQPCDDCVSRQEAINCVTLNEFRYKIVEDMKTLPSVTPKEKIGHWIGDKCSNCGNERAWYGNNPLFCPDCGARMQEVSE